MAIGVRFAQEDLAAMVISSRGSVGAAMTKMRRRGIVDVREGIVTVLASEKLREASVGKSERTLSTTRRRASPGPTVVPP